MAPTKAKSGSRVNYAKPRCSRKSQIATQKYSFSKVGLILHKNNFYKRKFSFGVIRGHISHVYGPYRGPYWVEKGPILIDWVI